ncbi:MAG: UDP-N-acetylmuramoyl-L-alanyl-D-glutamate--2,6-diaminopimelate ligase [Acutalibacter sp.]|jgi:UDP-N-acetylmuramoyl-L-alanyl-D-glutamate--2,6-diaminopimelate ligase
MKLSRLLAALSLNERCDDMEITDIVYDSRKACPGCAFVCMRGANSDGHKYAAAAAAAGAAVIFAEEPVDAPGAQVLLVEDTRKALALLSAAFFGNPGEGDITVIGVTGTKGKTTTAYMIHSILESAGHKCGVIGTIGVLIGQELIPTDNTTPMSYDIQKYLRQMADQGCEYCVMEASSIGLKDLRVYGFPFAVGVFTNFSEDHIGGVEHKDMQEYLESKAKLFSMCRVGVLNADDPSLEGILQGHTCQVKTYGFDNPADLRGTNCRHLNRPGFLGIAFEVSGEENFTAEVDIPGRFNAYNALAAMGACHELGIPAEAMKQGLSTVKVKGRVEPVPVPGNYTLLLDYAHNAVSMENILTTLREYEPKRLICLFGAGGNRPKVRRYEMGEVSGNLADLSVITADNSRFEDVHDIIADIKTGMAKTDGKFIEIPDRREAIRWCLENAQDGDIIVLAGKGHEDYQEIQGKKYPFDERVVIQELLDEMAQSPNPGGSPELAIR